MQACRGESRYTTEEAKAGREAQVKVQFGHTLNIAPDSEASGVLMDEDYVMVRVDASAGMSLLEGWSVYLLTSLHNRTR